MTEEQSAVEVGIYTIRRIDEDHIALEEGNHLIAADERIKWPSNLGPALDTIAEEIESLRADNERLARTLNTITTAIENRDNA